MLRQISRLSLRVMAHACLIGTIVTLLNLATTAALLPADRLPLRQALDTAFEDGTLPHGHNECLILSSLVVDYRSSLFETLAIRSHFSCERLQNYLNGANEHIGDYHRYLNGWRIYYLVMLYGFDLKAAFWLPEIVGFLLLLAGLSIQIYKVVTISADAPDRRHQIVERIGMISILLAFLFFFGWSQFGSHPTHALPSMFLFAILIWLSVDRVFSCKMRTICLIFSLFGALTAQFDFFTGAAPLALATTIGALGLQMRSTRTEMSSVVVAAGCVVGAFVTAFVAKFAISYLLLGPTSFDGTLEQLAYRMHGSFLDRIDTAKLDQYFPSWRDYIGYVMAPIVLLFGKLLYAADRIGYGNRIVGGAMIIGSFSVLCLYCGMRGRRMWKDHQVSMMLLSILVIVAWYGIFFQHAVIHTGFMVRLLVWPIAVAIFLVGVLLLDRVERADRRLLSWHHQGRRA